MQFGKLGGGQWQRIARLTKLAQSIFVRNNYDGFIYLSVYKNTLFKESTGITPVAAAEDPMGFLMDYRFGGALGPELVTNGTFADLTGWVSGVTFTSTAAAVGGEMQVTATTNFGRQLYSFTTVTGKTYKVTGRVRRVSGAGSAYLAIAKSGEGDDVIVGAATTSATFVDCTAIFTATGTTSKIACAASTSGNVAACDDISVKLLDGNHCIQATAPARPTFRLDANVRPYSALIGTDDNMTCTTGGAGDAGFYYLGALRPTGAAGTLRTLFADNGTNTGYKVQLDASDKLSFSAGNGSAFTTKASTAAVSVGTISLLSAYDDAVNLNVQIDGGTVESVARPVVVAGTSGFTRGKDNGAASSFCQDDRFCEVYVKNACPSAADQAIFKALAAACAGVL